MLPRKSFTLCFYILVSLVYLTVARSVVHAQQAPVGLMCELLSEPELTVINRESPHFSWIVSDESRGAEQTAYQLIIENLDTKTQVFDSGKQISDQSSSVSHDLLKLESHRTYSWRVRTWNRADNASAWSKPQVFKTGKVVPNLQHIELSPFNRDFANRYPLEKDQIRPVQIIDKGNGSYFVDFGRAAFGTVVLTVATDHATVIPIRLGEVLLSGKKEINQKPGKARRFASLSQATESGVHEYTLAIPNDPYNTRDAAIHIQPGVHQVFPFRYCEIDHYPGRLTEKDIYQSTVHYHFDDQAASFQSSSDVLNAVWELCHYSMKATSYLGAYVDGDRERTAYEADAYINQLGHYSVDRDYSIDRYSYQFLLQHPTWPLEWQHHMILIAWADYLYTGDVTALALNYEALSAKTLKALDRGDGLISADPTLQTDAFKKSVNFYAPIRIVLDWPYPERDGHQVTQVDSVANAFYYRSLVLMAHIAEVLGKSKDATQWLASADKVQKKYEQVFYNTKTGLYRDGEGVGHSSMHASLFPLAFGLVPSERHAALSDFIASKGMACSVYASQYLLETLFENNKDLDAVHLLTSTSKRSWYNMIRVGSTISMEAWDDSFKPNEDWNHAWGAAPANLVPRYVVGVRPVKAAYREFTVDPRLGDLTYVRMQIPTIKGAVAVQVSQENKTWSLDVRIPANTLADVSIPCTDLSQITESGKTLTLSDVIRDGGIQNGKRLLYVKAGHYQFKCPLTK